MSISFTAEMAPIVGWDLKCVCGAQYLEPDQALMTYDGAVQTLTLIKASGKGLLTCEDDECFIYGIFPHAVEAGDEAPVVNMSYFNARAVLDALGLIEEGMGEEDYSCGSEDAEAFMGRALMALAVAPESAERLTETVVTEGGATMVWCGVPEGYVQDRLLALLKVAEFCRANGRQVVWS